MAKNKRIEDRSPDVQEIIGQVPHWLIRWGLTAIFSVVIILVFLAWFISYPDVVNVSIEIMEAHDINPNYKFIAEGLAPELYFRDIQAGQMAQIRLTAYPFATYGALKGSVISKSELNGKGQFKVTIALMDGLLTTHHKSLAYYTHLTGAAQVILNETKVINKIFNHLTIRK